MSSSKHVKAFTLVELLVVVAIIGILAGIILPVLGKARENAYKVACVSNLKQIGTALRIYANEHGESFPTDNDGNAMESLSLLYSSYLSNREIFSCSSNSTDTSGLTSQTDIADGTAQGISFNCSYGYDPTKDTTINPGVALASDIPTSNGGLGSNHKNRGTNILYIDGHVEWKGTVSTEASDNIIYDDNIYRSVSGGTSSPTTGTDSVIMMN